MASKTMHHVVIGSDTYEIVDEQGRANVATNTQDISALKEDYDDIDDRVTALEGGGSGSGLTEDIKAAMLQIAQKVAYVDAQGQTYYDALYGALYPPADLVRISCVYTQSGTVYDTDSLDSLKSDLVVTAHYDNETTQVVTNYTLSGTLVAGTTSTITVSYGGKTTTFGVVVYEPVVVVVETEGNNVTLNEAASIGTSYEGCKKVNNSRFRTVSAVPVSVGDVITYSATNVNDDTLGAYLLWFDENQNYTGQHSSKWDFSGIYTVDKNYPYLGICFKTQNNQQNILNGVLTVTVQGS